MTAVLLFSGEGGIRTLGRVLPRQPLSRRSQSATLAPPQLSASSKAEGEGFEPTVKLSPHTCFQDRRLKPLGHPSITPGQADRF